MITRDFFHIPPDDGNYLSVRHLSITGTNREIGRFLAEYALREFKVEMAQYVDPVYALARLNYFKRNWPAHYERMLGVAEALAEDPYQTIIDLSALRFTVQGAGCSVVFIPPPLSASGKPLVGRNFDWYTVSSNALYGLPVTEGEKGYNTDNVVVEMYPDDGLPSLQLGSHDLLNLSQDGLNSKGLFVTVLSDGGARFPKPGARYGDHSTGLSMYQVVGMLLNKCSTVAEAKLELLQHHIYTTFSGLHYLIADAEGNATVFEIDGEDDRYYFTDAQPGKPFIVTNHPLHRFPTLESFPFYEQSKEHNTFRRFALLTDYAARHQGKFTAEDVQFMLDMVRCGFADPDAAGIPRPFPERTIWTMVGDLADRQMSIQFYLGDGGREKGTNRIRLRMSEPVILRI